MWISAAIVLATIVVILLTARDSLLRQREATAAPVGPETIRSSQDAPRILSTPRDWLPVTFRNGTSQLVLLAWLGLGIGFVVVGQAGLVPPPASTSSLLLWLTGLILIVLLDWQSERPILTIGSSIGKSTNVIRLRKRRRIILGTASAATAAYLWTNVPSRGIDDRSVDLVILWLASMAAITIAGTGGLGRKSAKDVIESGKSHWPLLLTVGALSVFAGIIRFVDLNSYPLALSGDEGTFAVAARKTTEGDMVNPFASGPWGIPRSSPICRDGSSLVLVTPLLPRGCSAPHSDSDLFWRSISW